MNIVLYIKIQYFSVPIIKTNKQYHLDKELMRNLKQMSHIFHFDNQYWKLRFSKLQLYQVTSWMGRQSNWDQQEDQILLQVLREEKSKKWKKVSLKLKLKDFYRTPSECRERFINYLFKDIDKGEIRDQELEILYEKYDEVGAKWSFIQSFLSSRTQCKLKNIFYGNVINILKTSYKYFTQKTAFFINSLSTEQLISIFDGSGMFQGLNVARKGVIAMKYKNNKAIIYANIVANEEAYLKLLNTILVQIFKQKNLTKMSASDKANKIVEKIEFRYKRTQSYSNSICKQQYKEKHVAPLGSDYEQSQQEKQNLYDGSSELSERKKEKVKIKLDFLIKKEEEYDDLPIIEQHIKSEFQHEAKQVNEVKEEDLNEYYRKVNYRPFLDPAVEPFHYPFSSSFCNYPLKQ